jgi:ribosomal protein S18 acetylase RimI-like enzyme
MGMTGRYGYLLWLATSPERKRAGIGRRLFQAFYVRKPAVS